jgi:transposase
MPGLRLPMRKIRDVLRLRAGGMSKRKIAASLSIGVTAAGECVRRARRAGLIWPLPEDLSDAALELRLYPPPQATAKDRRPQPDWAAIHRELRRPGVTLQLLWEEHRGAHSDGYGYSRYCELYRAWEGRLAPTMRQLHVAGERMFVDYAGTTLEVVDGTTGEVRVCQLFVAALGASNYTYAEATFTQRLVDWIGSHVRAFEFFGGVTAQIVSDNLRSGITKACFYEPAVNRTYAEMAAHYDTAVVPARPRKPRDKAKVEVAVQVATRWIIAKLRNRRFFSLDEINAAIRELVAQLNDRVTRHLATSRIRCSTTLSVPRSRSCRPNPTSTRNGRNARSASITMSKSSGITTRCRTRSCARRCGHGSRRAPSRSSIAASGWRLISDRTRTGGTRRCPSTCRRATGSMPTGRRSGSDGRPARSGAIPRRWLRSSCASARTPSRASAPRSASSDWPGAMASTGWRRPAAGRWRSAHAPSPPSIRS